MPGFYNPTPSYDEYLQHHGILGQKWGKKNGPPYPLDSEDHSSSEEKAGWKKSLTGDSAANEDRKAKKYKKQYDKIRRTAKTDEEKDARLRKLDEKNAKLEKKRYQRTDKYQNEGGSLTKKREIIKNQNLLTEDNVGKDRKRAKQAADLGLKALNKIGRDGYNEKQGITDSDRSWFLYEDQTIGLPTIADLVIQGKSKNEILDLIDEASKADYDTRNKNAGYFELDYNRDRKYSEPFIDACIELKERHK